tara:strand:+ start:6825 stop:7607 length:783 start_codon:yes stop_codon:yes gene_type:complete
MLECVMRLANGIVIKRCIPDTNVFETLSALTATVQQCWERFGASAGLVIIRDKPHGVGPKSGIKFTNICGKIDHISSRRVYHPGVEPLVKSVSNGFGRFKGIYSKHCNLLTCTTRSSTLFRGGRRSKAIAKVVEHAIDPESISRMTVHMLVANARLGHGVCVDSHYLDNYVSEDPRWRCVPIPQHEEMAYVKSLRLTEFQQEFASSMKISAPDSIVVSVSKNGSVNFFVTMSSDVEFRRNIEREYIPFLEELMEVVNRGS